MRYPKSQTWTGLCLLLITMAVPVFAQAPKAKDAPAGDDVIAEVLDRKITTKEKRKLRGIILGTLLERFAAEQKIEPTDEELDAFVKGMEASQIRDQEKAEQELAQLENTLEAGGLSKQDLEDKQRKVQSLKELIAINQQMLAGAERMRPMKRQMGKGFVQSWKINKALFAKYGGRVAFQQAGPEPVDAYLQFLKEQQKEGAFQIQDEEAKAAFWAYFSDEKRHRFYQDKAKAAEAINTPWWTSEVPVA